MTDRPTLLLLDGHSLAYRAFHALPEENFTTSTGQATNAVYGFTSMLLNVLRDEQPTHIAVAFDVSRQTFRSQAFPDYKATRSASPASFRGQVDLIREVLRALRITTLELDGFEADDIIATLAVQARAAGWKVDILTGDRDTFQLVDDAITVLYPKKGVSDLQRTTPTLVEEKYGLRPDQYADYAALRGDPSDNLPGIPGVGEKTAAKWLQEHGTLDELLAHADNIKGKVGEALRAAQEQVRLNRHLTQLVHDAPLGDQFTGLDSLAQQSPDSDAVAQLFDTLQFRTLLSRLPGGSSAVSVERAELTITLSDASVASWLSTHRSATIGVATDDSGLGLGVAEGSAIYRALAALDATEHAALHAWWDDPAAPKSATNVKHVIRHVSLTFATGGAGWQMDTGAAAYLLNPGQAAPSVGDLAARFLDAALPQATQAELQDALFGAQDDAARQMTCAIEAVSAAALAAPLAEALQSQSTAPLLHEMELPVAEVLAAMENAGIAVDLAGMRALEHRFTDDCARIEASAHAEAGRTFNLGSPKQLQELLFEERGLPHTKRIKTGYSTDVEALTYLQESTDDPLPALLLQYREVSRLRQTVSGLIASTGNDGRIHTTFQQFVAATGRLSSTDPNLQNIPVRTEDGRLIRGLFVVGGGYECLLTADYSQIELRLMAHLSQDQGLIEAFNAGEDIHTTVAAGVFGVAAENVDAAMRRKVKAMSYGLAYGLSAFGLAQQLRIDQSEARTLMDEYFGRFDGVRRFLAKTVDDARAVGYTETMFGRRRYLPDLNSDNRQRRDIAERMALNAPIQGTAADIVKLAMVRVHRDLQGMKSRLLLQVHDELVVEVAPGELEAVTSLVHRGMTAAVALTVPMDINIGVGRSWDEAAH